MRHIKSLYIKGFKKFNEITVQFNENTNVLVGENEAGKSTILEAIKIVLNQMYKNTDKSILKDLFNKTQVEIFNACPSIETLPKIEIELDLELERTEKNTEYFFGENSRNTEASFGIRFECSFNEEIGANLVDVINSGEIPYEYYNLSWEKCFYVLNKKTLDGLIEINQNANYLFHEKDYGKVLGKVLNNKVDTAYIMLNSGIDFVIPQYIQDAIKWLNE